MSTELEESGLDETGPIDYLVVEFPGNRMTGEGLPLLVDLVEAGIIRILDLAFVTRELDGSVKALEISDFDGDGQLDLAVFEGASSGLLGPDDIDEATSVIEPGNSAGILVYENVWAAPFAAALRRGGAQLVASGRIPVQAILAALDASEADASPTPRSDRRAFEGRSPAATPEAHRSTESPSRSDASARPRHPAPHPPHPEKGPAVATLTAWAFPTVDGADKAVEHLKQLQTQQLIKLQDAAVVTWPVDKKKPKTQQLNNLTGAGALGGAFWGMLFGLLFFIPLLGAAIGAGMGALAGSMSDVGH